MQKIEEIILKSFFENEEYAKKVVPFFKVEYFDDHNSKMVVKKILEYVGEYKGIPNYETTFLNIQNDKKLSNVEEIVKTLTGIKTNAVETYDLEFLMKETEKHFQEVALSKAVIESAEILGTTDLVEKQKRKALIPEKIRAALKITFDTKLGQEYLSTEEIEAQYFYYHHQERKFPFARWTHLNEIMDGGPCKKTLNNFLGVSGSGKTTWLCNIAEQYVSSGIDVLYVSLEISEREVLKRIDGNLLDTKIKELPYISKKDFTDRLQTLKARGFGRLIVKEFPPASINTQHLRFLMDDLKLRSNFVPTCLIVDYIGIMTSCRVKHADNSYNYVKSIVEELRGLAVDKDLICFSALQGNRSSYGNSDFGMENTADSIGSVYGSDWLGAIIETDELKANGKQMLKQLKSRYEAILPSNERYLVQILKDKQRIEEIEGDGGVLPEMNLEPKFKPKGEFHPSTPLTF